MCINPLHMKRKIGVSIIIFVLTIPTLLVLALAWSGFFSNSEIHEKTMGPFVLVYEEHTGPYKGTARIMDRIYERLKEEDNIETFKGFGIYYDNPKETPEEQLRSIAGCIIEPADTSRIKTLQGKYTIMNIPEKLYVTSEMPFRSQLSVFAGIVKVYPALGKYMKDKGYARVPAMEIYDSNKTIIYLFEVVK